MFSILTGITLIVFYFHFARLSDIGGLKNAAAPKKLIYKAKIIPDLIDEAPHYAVTVHYKNQSFNFGNKVAIIDIADKPKTVNWPFTKGEKYTLIMTGLDAPYQEDHKYREYIHWLVVNIPDQDIHKGDHLPVYNAALYYYQEGPHRVVYLIYHQNATLHVKGDHHHTDFMKVKRENFSTRSFAKEYGLGKPFAINWAEVDEGRDLVTLSPDF